MKAFRLGCGFSLVVLLGILILAGHHSTPTGVSPSATASGAIGYLNASPSPTPLPTEAPPTATPEPTYAPTPNPGAGYIAEFLAKAPAITDAANRVAACPTDDGGTCLQAAAQSMRDAEQATLDGLAGFTVPPSLTHADMLIRKGLEVGIAGCDQEVKGIGDQNPDEITQGAALVGKSTGMFTQAATEINALAGTFR